jgi:hypothetical protein
MNNSFKALREHFKQLIEKKCQTINEDDRPIETYYIERFKFLAIIYKN